MQLEEFFQCKVTTWFRSVFTEYLWSLSACHQKIQEVKRAKLNWGHERRSKITPDLPPWERLAAWIQYTKRLTRASWHRPLERRHYQSQYGSFHPLSIVLSNSRYLVDTRNALDKHIRLMLDALLDFLRIPPVRHNAVVRRNMMFLRVEWLMTLLR